MAILRLTLANRNAEITRVNFALAEFLDEEGVSPATAHRVRLVVEELVVNVIKHGFDSAAPHEILLDVRTEPRGVAVTVEDDGKPFDPSRTAPPRLEALAEAGKSGGLGVAIIRKVARDLEYRRVEGRNHIEAFVENRVPGKR